MKRIFLARYDRSFFATAIAAGLLMVSSLSTHAEDAKPEELHEKVGQLQRKAEELKAEGREEEANKLMRGDAGRAENGRPESSAIGGISVRRSKVGARRLSRRKCPTVCVISTLRSTT